MKTINPATGEFIEEYDQMDNEALDTIAQDAATAQKKWRRNSFYERGLLLQRVAELLEGNKEKYAKLMAREMGKPLAQAESEIEKCAWV